MSLERKLIISILSVRYVVLHKNTASFIFDVLLFLSLLFLA